MIRNMIEKGISISEIARKLGIDRKTVRKYANSDGIPVKRNPGRGSRLDPYRDRIRELIDAYNLSAVRILEEIRALGYDGGYTILKEYCSSIRKDRRISAVYRYETDPGKQSQVDFGSFGIMHMDGIRKRLYAFSMILGYSRMRYAEYTTDISTENFIRMHLNAFRYFHGYTDTILYDNTKQIVLERKIPSSESRFNPRFLNFAEYYGFVVRLCYPYRAQTKGKIESTIKYLRNNFWNGRSFSSLEDINVQLLSWLDSVNNRVHGTTHEIPRERLAKEHLNPVGRIPEYFTRREEVRKVSRDCYVAWKGNRYSVPWIHAGREALVIEDSAVKIQISGSTVAEHDILPGTGRISRKKEHFQGLLKEIRDQNRALFETAVEKRDLKRYDEVA